MSDVTERLRELRAWAVPHIWLAAPENREMYVYQGGLARAEPLKLPELDFELQPADVFGV